MNTLRRSTLAVSFALTWLVPAVAESQETKLDYVKLTAYLGQQYGSRCKDGTSSTSKSLSCAIIGSGEGQPPYIAANVSEDDGQVNYTLIVRVNDPSEVAGYNRYYLETIGAIDEWGKPVAAVVPTISQLLANCFKYSELGKLNTTECRTFDRITDKLGAGLWGEVASGYYGFQFTIQLYKSR